MACPATRRHGEPSQRWTSTPARSSGETPLGSRLPGQNTGTINFGGPIVTASGLVFTGAAEDPFLRAFDAATGDLLWQHPLPVPAQSTPMTYTLHGRQFLVIAAGGHGDRATTKLGDS